MRRDQFTLEVITGATAGGQVPTLTVTVDGSVEPVRDRLLEQGEDDVDVAFRLLGDVTDADADGVLAITDRITGEFVLEVNATAGAITTFVQAVRDNREAGDGDQYRLVIRGGDEELATLEKRTFLVYDDAGGLLRSRSLIPSGVEL